MNPCHTVSQLDLELCSQATTQSANVTASTRIDVELQHYRNPIPARGQRPRSFRDLPTSGSRQETHNEHFHGLSISLRSRARGRTVNPGYLEVCKSDPSAYATSAERMLMAIGDPELVDTRLDPRLSRIFSNKMMKLYPAFGSSTAWKR